MSRAQKQQVFAIALNRSICPKLQPRRVTNLLVRPCAGCAAELREVLAPNHDCKNLIGIWLVKVDERRFALALCSEMHTRPVPQTVAFSPM